MIRDDGPKRHRRSRAATASAALLSLLTGCSTQPPLRTVEHVDLPRFMGDWHVIAHIPGWGEEQAYNGVESYALGEDGRIDTTYRFRDGGFDGPVKVMNPTGYVSDDRTNATWSMHFFWPLRFEYLITYLDPRYETTIIARTARDYAWIMARSPTVPEPVYGALVAELAHQGYDTSRLRRVPQRWPDPDIDVR